MVENFETQSGKCVTDSAWGSDGAELVL